MLHAHKFEDLVLVCAFFALKPTYNTLLNLNVRNKYDFDVMQK